MVQKRFLVPNLFTGLNFLIGIYAIMVMAESISPIQEAAPILGTGKPPIILAAWFLVWCVLFDKLDGFAAKMLNASSDFGAQFDSLADLTAFGIAPGFLAYFYLQTSDPAWFAAHRPLVIAAVSVFMLCAALRLARFNAIDSGELKGYFHGLPSTFGGGFVAVSVILHWKYGVAGMGRYGLTVVPLLLILAGILMVSPFYLPKLTKRRHKLFDAFQITNILIAYLCGFGMILPECLYIQSLSYAVVGFGYGILRKDAIDSAQESMRPA
jgi:CDP-diacylglycerol--serine O-phosphatidyltransferase